MAGATGALIHDARWAIQGLGLSHPPDEHALLKLSAEVVSERSPCEATAAKHAIGHGKGAAV